MGVIYILWLRELKRYVRSRAQILASISQPILYLMTFGFGFEPVFRDAGRGSYLQFITPGVVGMAILFTSTFSGLGILWDRRFGFLKETLVAPVPRFQIVLGRMLGGATVAVIQGTLVLIACTIVGFRPVHMATLVVAYLYMMFIAVAFGALATAIGSVIKDIQSFQLIINVGIVPVFLLSGAVFPLTRLTPALSVAARIDPLSYGIDALRQALLGASAFNALTNIFVLGIATTLFLATSIYVFSRLEA
jgi:ABC-2 type transport system permease protein